MKTNRIIVALVFLAKLTTVSFAQTTTNGSLTLQQCIETAIANNLQVRQAAYQAEADKADYVQAKANRLPFIAGNISHGINQGRSIDPFTNSYLNQQIGFANYNINTSVTIWNGSAITNAIKQNELNAKASELSWQQAKDNITINVILAYLQILSTTEQLSIAEKQVTVTKAQVDRLSILNNSGAIAPATLYDLKGQQGNDELNLLSLKNSLETAKITLAQLMNIPYSSAMVLAKLDIAQTPVLYESSSKDTYTAASEQLAIIKAADVRIAGAKSGLASAKAQRLPVLSLNGGLGTNYSSVASRQLLTGTADVATPQYVTVNNTKINVFAPQNSYSSQKISYGNQWKNNFNSSISLGLQVPILNRLTARNRIKQAEIVEKRAVFESESTKTQVRQAIDQAYVNMTTALERYQTLARQVQDLTISFKAAEVRFNAGVNTTIEYLLAKNNLDRANANFIAARYDYLLRIKVLDFYQGKKLW